MISEDQLTKRQRAIYRFLRDEIRKKGRPPSLREIGHRFRIKSSGGAACHLKALERAGLIEREPGRARSIRLVKEPPHALPLLGRIGAGGLREAVECAETFDPQEIIGPGGRAVLAVEDDIFIGLDIAPGSYLVIDPTCGWRKVVAIVRLIE